LGLRLRRRRKLEAPTPYHLQPYTYKYDPFGPRLPEPWRDTEGVYSLPLAFVLLFVDTNRFSIVRNRERAHVDALAKSILVDGLREPCEMIVDPDGKFRFDNGYHRLTLIVEHQDLFPRVPVTIRHTTKPIRGFGRQLSSELHEILEILTKTPAA
jgi:hypothetical protein